MNNTPLFPPSALASLQVAGIAARWNAVQEHLHPRLVLLAEHIQYVAQERFPRQWPLYEVSYKSQRYVNRGRGERTPIDDYHVAFDRPPRGSGVLVSMSGAERAVLVGLQLWGVRKAQLRQVWTTSPAIWQPLVERIAHHGQARFVERPRQRGDTLLTSADPTPRWIDRYLDSRSASYLWAGFVYPWDTLPDNLTEVLTEDVLELFLLNEAVMEQVEAHEPQGAALLREQRAVFSAQSPVPPIETIISRIHERGFTISDILIRAYHVALHTRPLVILPGISGTGKTRLTRLYADAVHGLASTDENPHYLIVAVQPDWHNARDLLGYYNAMTGLYHPTAFLRFLLRAAADPLQTYFVCLDEMNLARPEYYLAPILSALETTEHIMDLGTPADEVQMVTGEILRNPIRLPLNVRLTGTVNVDESTYSLSDKVLDRANVIEMTDVDLPAFRAAYRGPVDDNAWHLLTQVHAIVARAGQPFGYRTLGEMLRYLEQASGILSMQQALDLQLKQKVLPRLRGDDNPRLRRVLEELLTLLLGERQRTWSRATHIPADQVIAAPYPDSAEKVRRMLERLDQEGFTDFYG